MAGKVNFNWLNFILFLFNFENELHVHDTDAYLLIIYIEVMCMFSIQIFSPKANLKFITK